MAKKQGLLGRKIGMTQLFDDTGEIVPVTVIEAGPCYVTQVKSTTTDGYSAIQIGFRQAKDLSKPARGHLGNLPALRHLRELRTDDADQYMVGQVLSLSGYEPGQLVDVTGISKGKGFAGGVKRHHFKGGPKTRGQSDRQRAVGSIGSGTTPGRVWKGLRGPGHMGSRRVTTLNLEIVRVDPERNLLMVKGSIPGPDNAVIFIRKAAKTRLARRLRRLQG